MDSAVQITPEGRVSGSATRSSQKLAKQSRERVALTRLGCTVICTQPGLHSIQIPVTDNEYDVLRPERVTCDDLGPFNVTTK